MERGILVGHIYHALSEVQELKQKILEKQRFKGYSGRARAIAGTLAFAAAALMSSSRYPQTIWAHIAGWGAVFVLSVVLNFGAMIYWFLFDPAVGRDLRRLKPAFDAFPPLLVGGLLTWILLEQNLYQYLFGTWMCLFGLTNLAMRHALPKKIWLLGAFYTGCGGLCLLFPLSFLNPWPMGIVFLMGEWAAGFILHYDQAAAASFQEFLTPKESYHVEAG